MRNMTSFEKNILIRWFIHHMDQNTRGQLMGDLPVIYKLLHPNVSDEAITSHVESRIRVVEGQGNLISKSNLNL